VLLLSAGFWTKQTTTPAVLTAVVWLIVAAVRGDARREVALGMTLALAALNGLVFAALTLFTDGWAWRFIVDIPSRRAKVISVGRSGKDLLEAVCIPLAAAAAAWWAAWMARRRGASWPRESASVAAILALFIVINAPFGVWFHQAQGAVHNMYVGIGWACGLLVAAAWGIARRRLPSLLVAAGLVLALFALSESTRLTKYAADELNAHVPKKSLRAWVGFEPPALLRYSRHHLVYHPAYPGIGVNREQDFYPGGDNVETLLWSGIQPRYLIKALLQRRFDVVFPFENDGFRGDSDGYGRWEENYLWKLNRMINTKYRPARGPLRRLKWAGLVFVPLAPFYSPFVLVRRPGPDPAPWMSRCFGPFRVPGASWRIARGGGFWCRTQPGSSTLRLVATPGVLSEIRVDGFRARPGAALELKLTRPGKVRVSLGPWHVLRRWAAPGRATIALPKDASGDLSVLATRGSGAEVRLIGG
jgi:hypothetical protein